MKRQVARFEQGTQAVGIDALQRDDSTGCGRRHEPQRGLSQRGPANQRERRGREHQADVAPGADALIEHDQQFLGGRSARFLAMEVKQLVGGEAAEELDVVQHELRRHNLLGLATGRDIGVAARRPLGTGQPAGRQGHGAGEALDQSHRPRKPGPLFQAGQDRGEVADPDLRRYLPRAATGPWP